MKNVIIMVETTQVDFEDEVEVNTKHVLENIQVDVPIEHVALVANVMGTKTIKDYRISQTKTRTMARIISQIHTMKQQNKNKDMTSVKQESNKI